MAFQIGIEVDGSRIAWVQNSDNLNSVITKLTTLTADQRTAVIKFHLKTTDKKHLVCTETLNAIPPMEAGTPAIDVVTRLSGRILYYRISLNGRLVSEQKKVLSKYIHRPVPVLRIILIIAIIATAASLIICVPGIIRPSGTEAASEPANKKAPELRSDLHQKQPAAKTEVKITENSGQPAETEASRVTPEPARSIPEKLEVTWSESEIFDKHSVYFTPDSAELTAKTIAELNAFISALPAADDFEEGFFELAVRGHCAKYGTEEGRAELSSDRALNVTTFLRKRWGIEANYITSGAGASEPVSLARDEQHLNRRVDIAIKGSIRKKIASDEER
ncbi:MAG: OmpA family protein [Spirochaetales bacterium]|nr:OmpA family protein [Spirochaetales bacterium]